MDRGGKSGNCRDATKMENRRRKSPMRCSPRPPSANEKNAAPPAMDMWITRKSEFPTSPRHNNNDSLSHQNRMVDPYFVVRRSLLEFQGDFCNLTGHHIDHSRRLDGFIIIVFPNDPDFILAWRDP